MQNLFVQTFMMTLLLPVVGELSLVPILTVSNLERYIIEIANCPVISVSKLQTTIATSTMESEYTAMSMALRSAIPLLAVIESVTGGLHYHKHKLLTFKATVHEDNQGALIFGNLETGRCPPRFKFYALKLHWFRSWLKPKEFEIKFIPTFLQKANFFNQTASPWSLSTKSSFVYGMVRISL
mmetsp:Transcript_49248/g.50021  ORF Transcript_49248/g.50021 Transcript_49248/m.50021 type:complete len:182 (+) Transcript_49248:1001-1546(+)